MRLLQTNDISFNTIQQREESSTMSMIAETLQTLRSTFKVIMVRSLLAIVKI